MMICDGRPVNFVNFALKSSCHRQGRALVHQPIPGEMQVVPDEGPDEED